MAQPNLDKFSRRGLALKLQPTPGTPVVPSALTDGIRFYDGQSGTEFDALEENRDRAFFGGQPFSTYNHRAFVEGSVHVYPPTSPGAAGADGTPDCHALLLIAGLSQTLDLANGITRYNPISDNIAQATANFWHAGTLRQIYDARANISALGMEIGNRARAQLRVQGVYDGIGQQSVASVVVPETLGPVIESANSTLRITQHPGGVAGAPLLCWGKALTIDFGSQLATKEYTEHKETSIDGRQPTFTVRLARTLKADFDPWAVRAAGTYISADMRVKNLDGRYTEFGVRGLIREINETDIDGDYGWEISGPCIPTAAGGDEFHIAFGATP